MNVFKFTCLYYSVLFFETPVFEICLSKNGQQTFKSKFIECLKFKTHIHIDSRFKIQPEQLAFETSITINCLSTPN